MHNQEDNLNVPLQHLDGVTHTWGERWIAKKPIGDFGEFVDALTQRENHKMHLFQKDMLVKEYPMKFQFLESKAKLFADLMQDIYVSNPRTKLQTYLKMFELDFLEKVTTIAEE